MRRKKWFSWMLFLLVTVLFGLGIPGAGPALAAAPTPTTGVLTGTIRNGVTLLPISATVTAINTVTAQSQSLNTGSTGIYKFSLAAGTYDLKVEKTGYKSNSQQAISILAGKTVTVNKNLFPLTHGDRISSYAGPSTCLGCHQKDHPDLLQNVFNSVHFQLKSFNTYTQFPGGISGMADRVDATCGSSLLGTKFASLEVLSDHKKKPNGCGQCHIAYKAPFTYPDYLSATNDIDCLICHADRYGYEWDDPAFVAAYGQNAASHLRVPVTLADGTSQWNQDRSLLTAQSVKRSSATSCSRCHSQAMSFKRSTPYNASTDVHAVKGIACADCHTTTEHQIARGHWVSDLGAYDNPSVDLSCEKCHTVAPHKLNYATYLNKHTANVACETCHIQSLSDPTAMSAKTWAPFTLDPVTGVWSDTRPVPTKEFYDPSINQTITTQATLYKPWSQQLPAGTVPALRWFDGTSLMLPEIGGDYYSRRSTGGFSRITPFMQLKGGLIGDAAWLPGPASDLSFDTLNGTWPHSMKAYYEKYWNSLAWAGFVDASTYPTAQSYWNAYPEAAKYANNLPELLQFDRTIYDAEAGLTYGVPVPGPQGADNYPGIVRAINTGMGALAKKMGLADESNITEAIGQTMWSGKFFGLWAPQGDMLLSINHATKNPAASGMEFCYGCHYSETEYAAGDSIASKRVDFAAMGYTNTDSNPLVDPFYDTSTPRSMPTVEGASWKSAYSNKTGWTLTATVTIVDSISRVGLAAVPVTATMTGPAGQVGLPKAYSATTGTGGIVNFAYTSKTMLPGPYTITIDYLTYAGIPYKSGASFIYNLK